MSTATSNPHPMNTNLMRGGERFSLKMKVEEQTVPCPGGFSPQQESDSSSFGMNPFPSSYDTSSSVLTFDDTTGSGAYGNLADTFDLSLLGYPEDHDMDMATVPSPMSALEASFSTWQQTSTSSFYASSPEVRAFSPDDFIKEFPSSKGNNNNNQHHHSGGDVICNNNGVSTLSPSNDVNDHHHISRSDRNALLKQCLEDTSFQNRFMPSITVNDDELDAIMKSNPSNPSEQGSVMEMNQIDPVFSLAYEQLMSDVQNVCKVLSISQDPTQWSATDAQNWLIHSVRSMMSSSTSEEASVSAALQSFWDMDGKALCSLSEQEFRRRDPLNGSSLYSSLELWKMLQWNQNGNEAQTLLDEQDQWGLGSIMGTPTGGLSPQSSPSSSASVCSEMSVMDDIKLLPEPCTNSELFLAPSSHHHQNIPSPASSSVGTGSSKGGSDVDDESEDEETNNTDKSSRKGPTTPHLTKSKSGAHIHLWQFLKELLDSGNQHGGCIRWLDQSRGVFKIEDSVRVARLWGIRKNRPAMNYDKLSRSIRQYYRKGIMRKTERSQRLVYQFCHPYGGC